MTEQENKKYYHITNKDVKVMESILKDGLLCNAEGDIFVFENKSIQQCDPSFKPVINTVADCIAINQIFVEEYYMFEIDIKGITTELIPDDVAEISSKQQWIVKQPKIEAQYINLFGEYKQRFESVYQLI